MTLKYEILKRLVKAANIKRIWTGMSTDELLENRRRANAKNRIPELRDSAFDVSRIVMENIHLGKHGATDEEVRAAARAANCDEFVEKLPRGYETPIGENGAKLSGGERQRISIARALLKDAPIVLLDEATASLDVENETKVQGALSRLLAGKTVLVIAHRMRTVEAADKIVVLADGQVTEEGSPAELFAKENGMFRRMAQLQAASADWSL